MKMLSIVGKDYHTEEHVVGYYTTGDRMLYWGKPGAFWGGFWGCCSALRSSGCRASDQCWWRGRWSRGSSARSKGPSWSATSPPSARTLQHRHSEEQRRAIRDRGEKRPAPPGGPRNGRRGGTCREPCISPERRQRRFMPNLSPSAYEVRELWTINTNMATTKGHRRKLHHDWRLWLVVGLMLAAMVAYVLSDNERFGGRRGRMQPPAPAMNP